MIKVITENRAIEIINNPACEKNKGKFFVFENKNAKAIAIDNTSADAWFEEFETWTQAFKWLMNNQLDANGIRGLEK